MPKLPAVVVLSLGGTIAMTSGDASERGGVRPALDAAALVAAVPDIAARADVRAHAVRSVPGASLRFDDLLGVLAAAHSEVDAGAAGIVVTQGTDTIEESAYFLDLVWDRPEPLVVTGAMRHPGQAGADGPANLLASVVVATSAPARERGVLVVLNDEIHSARQVRKTHSSGLGAFASPDTGPAGRVREGSADFFAPADRRERLPVPAGARWPRVGVVEAVLDEAGELLPLISQDTHDAMVISAFGVGHVSETMAERIGKLTASMPVTFASRTGAGGTFERTYGFPGSEADLLARGAIPAGRLDPRKARILLTLLLADGAPLDEIRAAFLVHGGTGRGRS